MSKTFVIGDVHGEARLLHRLVDALLSRANEGDTLVFLGDYINRGPDSRGVIDQILALQQGGWPGPVVALLGNHESEPLDCLDRQEPGAWSRYLNFMGAYPLAANYADDYTLARFRAGFPPEHERFLRELKPWHEDRNAVYVRAGFPTGKHPRHCAVEELLWSSRFDYTWEKPVVFGHQRCPGDRPISEPGFIALDTGCGMGGPLTAVTLPDREFVTVAP